MKRPLVLVLAAVVGVTPLMVATPSVSDDAAPAAAARRAAVVEHRVLGRTVQGRKIHAFRLGNPNHKKKVVVLAAMHGDERAPIRTVRALRDGKPITGADLWVVPQYNVDGVVAGTRKNANGVDLNRNFPYQWAPLDGEVESGPGPASEPETRAVMRFLRDVDPRFVVSFHQPLNGIDVYGPKKRWFARRLARSFQLPMKEFACGNSCHGTLTQWFNHHFDGVAVTVEFGRRPSLKRMGVRAPRQLLRAVRAQRVRR